MGGEEVFEDLTDSDGARAKDGRYWSFMDERADFEALAQGTLSAGKVFGLARAATTLQQGREGNPQVVNESNRNPSVPSLSDMTLGAIQALSDDPDGFFLMVEGGAVDWANHSNEKGRMIEEQSAFNAAVSEVVAWVEENSNWEETLLIVTADHECGYLWGTDERAFVPVGDNGAGNLPAMVFHADTHSNVPVPCYVKGTGAGPFLDGLVDGTDPFFAELFSGFDPGFSGAFIDNTDLFLLMSRWLEGEDEGTNGAGHWFKGDLHAHSLHSDGNAPVAAVLNSAEHKELDFFVLTEHDTDMFDSEDPGPVMPTHWDDPDYTSEETVLLYGVEWTTGKGHANAWATAPFDYTPLWHANTGLDAVAAVYGAHDGDALFSINHPSAIFCCPWEYDVDNAVDTIEIWNSMYRIPNLNGWSSHPFWDAELLKGRRMTGVGGSDTHKLAEYASDPFAKIEAALFGHGNPTTWVYAEEKTGDAILRSLKNGHVSLSYAPDAERLDLVADRDGDGYFETLMGDNLIQTPGRELSFQIDIRNPAPPGWFAVPRVKELTPENLVKLAAGEVDLPALLGLLAGKDTYLVGVLKNGIPHRAWIVSGGATRVTFDDVPASRGRTYYRAELMGTPDLLLFQRLLYGRVKAVTNPIYVNFPAR